MYWLSGKNYKLINLKIGYVYFENKIIINIRYA